MAAPSGIDLTEETIFTWGAPPLKFGAGAVDESPHVHTKEPPTTL